MANDANQEKAQSGSTFFNDNEGTSETEGVNPYSVGTEFTSDTGSAGGRPGATLRLKGADHG